MSDLEYEHIETKRSLSESHEATIAIAAFATARGGTVRFGITPEGRRIGVQLWVQQNAPALVVRVHHMYNAIIRHYGSTFICPLED